MNSKRWRQLRTDYLRDHPLCERCADEGKVRAAQCVHHINPVESGHTDEECARLCFAQGNLMALCYRCHADIHKAEHSHTKEGHQQREDERLKRWIERHERARANSGEGFKEGPQDTPKSTPDIFCRRKPF